MSWRLDLILQIIAHQLGPVWAAVAVATLMYVVFGPLIRAMMLTVFILVFTQFWYAPLYHFSRHLRWWCLIILALRALYLLVTTSPPPGESRAVHRLLIALSAMAFLSVAWGTSPVPMYNVQLAGSFVIGLVLTFGLLWRMLDLTDVLAIFARSVTWFSLFVFGGAFLLSWISQAIGAHSFAAAGWLGGRWGGLFYNPNMGGLFGALVLPIVLACPKEYLGAFRWFKWITVIAIVACIYLSGSRSAVLGASLALAFLGMHRFGAGAFLSLLFMALWISVFVAYAPNEAYEAEGVASFVRIRQLPTLSGRLDLWEKGWDAAQDALFLGHGWGESRFLSGGSRELAVERGAVVFGFNLHSAHVQLLVDLGLCGVAVFWAFCGVIVGAAWTLLRAPASPRTMLVVVICSSLLAMLADTFVHGSILSMGGPGALVFWGFAALVLKEVDRIRRGVQVADASAVHSERPVPVPGWGAAAR